MSAGTLCLTPCRMSATLQIEDRWGGSSAAHESVIISGGWGGGGWGGGGGVERCAGNVFVCVRCPCTHTHAHAHTQFMHTHTHSSCAHHRVHVQNSAIIKKWILHCTALLSKVKKISSTDINLYGNPGSPPISLLWTSCGRPGQTAKKASQRLSCCLTRAVLTVFTVTLCVCLRMTVRLLAYWL